MRLVEILRRKWTKLFVHPPMGDSHAWVRALVARMVVLADRRRHIVAVTGAVLLHVLFLLFLLPQTSEGLSTGGSGGLAGDGGGEGLTLDLTTLKIGPGLATAVVSQSQEDFMPTTPVDAPNGQNRGTGAMFPCLRQD